MAGTTYDEIADWYEQDFLGAQPDVGADEIGQLLRELLGKGQGTCLDLGCGTGAYASPVRDLGWTPVGVDLSAGMLRYARGRLPAARADAADLPVATCSVDAAVSVMVHTDMPAYDRVVQEVVRVLRPAGLFVHLGVHPCFCGGFADRSDPDAIVIGPGYGTGHWTTGSYTTAGLRSKVGATHRPLPELFQLIVDAGMTVERLAEGGGPTPFVLAVRARRGP